LAITGILSGLWHGLGWTFVAWGAIQTLLMLFAHWRRRRSRRTGGLGPLPIPAAIALTFAITCLIGGMFRAPTLFAARNIYGSLFRWNLAPTEEIGWRALAMLAALATVAWGLPGARQILGVHWNAIDPRSDPPHLPRHPLAPILRFRLGWAWGLATALLFVLCLTQLDTATRFVYVQF